jgi:Concanavalin A-like lectin/glucanases superfamily/Right handed beta helix region/Fibronectin type III domain
LSNFPDALDNIVENVTDSTPQAGLHASLHNQLADAVNAIQAALLSGIWQKAGTPDAPANLRATAGDRQVTLSWDTVVLADSYRVERATNSSGPWESIATVTAISHIVPDLTNGTVYWFRVASAVGSTTGPYTAPVSATPAAPPTAPVSPTLAALTPGDKSLSTTVGAVAGATSYQVFINTSASWTNAEVTFPATTSGQTSGYSVTLTTIGGSALTNGTTYHVMARAVNAVGASPNSPSVSGAPSATPVGNTFDSRAGAMSPTHWWKLNETSGTNLDDAVATNPLDATLSGSYTLNQASLMSDGDAANKSILWADGAGTTASSADFYRDGTKPYSWWITYKRTSANDGEHHNLFETSGQTIYYDNNNMFAVRFGSGYEHNIITTPPAVGATEHVLMRYDGSTLKLNKNGSLVDSIASTSSNTTGNDVLRIASSPSGAGFEGNIDCVLFWHRSLTDAEALELYQAATGTLSGGGGTGGGGSQTDLHENLTNPPAEKNSTDLTNLRNAILATPSGSTYNVPDGIYRIGSNAPIHIPGGVKVVNANKRAWFFLSRNWATGGEAGNTWTGPTSGYYTSSRAVPTINPNEPGGVTYDDQAKALRYEMCVGITSAGVVTRFTSIAAGGTPTAGQFCFTSAGTRTIRLGTNPANFSRIEVVEADSATGRWFWPDGAGVTVEGCVFRYAASGPVGDPAGSHDQHNFTMRNCVVGDCHGAAINVGGSNNVVIEACLMEYAGGSGLLSYLVNGLTTNRNHILNCGFGGWDTLWGGGATKFTVTTNHTCNDNTIANCFGSGLWWDESCVGPVNVHGNLIHHCAGPLIHYEISTGPAYIGTERGNCFAYNDFPTDVWPVVYVSSSTGPGEIANNLIIAGSSDRALQVYWAQERTNDKTVRDWYWHNNRYILEGDEAAIFVGGGAEAAAQNNRGSSESYYFANGSPEWVGGVTYSSIGTWNTTPFDEGGVLVDLATANTWRAAWGV